MTKEFVKSVLVDDLRDIKADVAFRNFQSACFFSPCIEWDNVTLYLDHDLGPESGEGNGYKYICYMIENDFYPDEVYIVSSNPVGCDNIARALENTGLYKKIAGSPRNWEYTGERPLC